MTKPPFFPYIDDYGDTRVPFDPAATASRIAGCVLCRFPVAIVGVFVPNTDEMRAVVLRLRRHAQRESSISAVAYGLCAECAEHRRAVEHVEDALERAAAKVALQ